MSDNQITKEEFTRILDDAKRHKEDAKEANGRHGQVVQQAVETHNLNPAAFKSIVGLAKKEPTKQQDFIRAFLLYADYAEMFDSVDAFDDLGQLMIDIGKGIKKQAQPVPADKEAAEAVGNMVN